MKHKVYKVQPHIHKFINHWIENEPSSLPMKPKLKYVECWTANYHSPNKTFPMKINSENALSS